MRSMIKQNNSNRLKVCILDYGSGNVRSVYNMVSTLTSNVKVSNSPAYIKTSSHLILPGVGAFKAAMQKINRLIPLALVTQEVEGKKKPFLGICVGMQILSDSGFEFEESRGLGWIKGKVEKLNSKNLPLPHVGWNNIQIKKSCQLTHSLAKDQDFYFVHSFVFKAKDSENIVATTRYGNTFASIISKGNVYGVQFHPEKSQKAGKVLMQNFLSL